MNPSTVFSDPYVVVTLQSDAGLVRYTRTAVPFPNLSSVREHNTALATTLETLMPGRLAVLIDVRSALPRNDEEFEAEMTRAVGKLLQGFRAHAFLVKTAVGSLQVRRLSSTRGLPANATFSDEAAALRHLGVA